MAKILNRPSQVIVPETHFEHPDPSPMTIPAGFRRPERLEDQIMRLVKRSIDDHARANDLETFEDFLDFDIDEEVDPQSPYEVFYDPVLDKEISPQEFKDNAEAYKNRYVKAQMERFSRVDTEGALARNLYRQFGAAEPAPEKKPAPRKDKPVVEPDDD